MNLQDQFDEAMFDFNRGGLDRAVANLQVIVAVELAAYEAQKAFRMPYTLFFVKTSYKPKPAAIKLPEDFPDMPRQRNKV